MTLLQSIVLSLALYLLTNVQGKSAYSHMQWQVHYCTGQKTCVDENEAHCKYVIESHTARWVEGACILQSQEFFKRCCNSCCRGFFDEFGLEAIMDGADPNSITEKAIVVTTKAVTEA